MIGTLRSTPEPPSGCASRRAFSRPLPRSARGMRGGPANFRAHFWNPFLFRKENAFSNHENTSAISFVKSDNTCNLLQEAVIETIIQNIKFRKSLFRSCLLDEQGSRAL